MKAVTDAVSGADANELTARRSVRIDAPPDVVWAVVGDFNGLTRWLPVVAACEIVVGSNNEVGAVRLATRRDGTKVTERLVEYDPQGMRLGYTYVDGVVTASDCFPVITVTDGGDSTCVVEWSARFKRLAFTVDPPPCAQDDKSLTDRFNGLFEAGLQNLKRVIEAGR
jgi:mxaD protein